MRVEVGYDMHFIGVHGNSGRLDIQTPLLIRVVMRFQICIDVYTCVYR